MNHGSVVAVGPPQEGKLDLSLTPDQETFRATVRAWLTQNIPREWKPIGSSEIPRKEQYELLLRAPMIGVIEQLAHDFRSFAPDQVASAKTSLDQKTRHPIRELVQLSVGSDLAIGLAKGRALRVGAGNLAELESQVRNVGHDSEGGYITRPPSISRTAPLT
jgi:hypothetical protein